MPFADIEIKFGKSSDFKKTEFMQLQAGAHTVRILQAQAKTKPTHFFNHAKASVLCLGDDCPICANNKKLSMENRNAYKENSAYVKVNYRFFVNVLDKTLAKVCTKCGAEHKNLATTVCTCGEVLPAAAPLNKVKVLSKGLTLRDDLDSIDRAILDATGTPIGLTGYDVVLMVSGTGRDTKITPVPRTEANAPVNMEGLELYDLDKAIIELNPEEMLDLARGISLKDIFSARKTNAPQAAPVEPIVSQEELDDIASKVSNLFDNK